MAKRVKNPPPVHLDGRGDVPIFIHAEVDDLGLDPYEFRLYAHMCRVAGQGKFQLKPYEVLTIDLKIGKHKIRECLKVLVGYRLIDVFQQKGRSITFKLLPRSEFLTIIPEVLPNIASYDDYQSEDASKDLEKTVGSEVPDQELLEGSSSSGSGTTPDKPVYHSGSGTSLDSSCASAASSITSPDLETKSQVQTSSLNETFSKEQRKEKEKKQEKKLGRPEQLSLGGMPPTAAEVVISHMGSVTGRAFRMAEAHLRLVRARIADGYTVAHLCLVADYLWDQWGALDHMRARCCPETAYGPETIERYAASAKDWEVRGRPSQRKVKVTRLVSDSSGGNASLVQDHIQDYKKQFLAQYGRIPNKDEILEEANRFRKTGK